LFYFADVIIPDIQSSEVKLNVYISSCDPLKEHDGAERSEKSDDNTPGQSEIKSVPHETKEKGSISRKILIVQ